MENKKKNLQILQEVGTEKGDQEIVQTFISTTCDLLWGLPFSIVFLHLG